MKSFFIGTPYQEEEPSDLDMDEARFFSERGGAEEAALLASFVGEKYIIWEVSVSAVGTVEYAPKVERF
jgi:hypothetical protein